jgi:hypothetical protein
VTPPVAQMSYSPCYRSPTRSKSRRDPPHGLQATVPSIQPLFLEGKRPHRSERLKVHPGGAVSPQCSNVNVTAETKSKTSSVMTQAAYMSYLPGYPPPTHSKARISSPHSPQATVISIQPNSLEGEHYIGLKKSKLHHGGAVNQEHSKTNVRSMMKHPFSSLSPRDRGDTQRHVDLQWRVNDPVDNQRSRENVDPEDRTAVSNTQPQPQTGPCHHDLEVSRLCHSDTVRQKRPRSDVVPLDRGKKQVKHKGNVQAKSTISPRLPTRDIGHASHIHTRSTTRNSTACWEYPDYSSDIDELQILPDPETVQMACIRQYMHYPAQGRLVGCLNDDISLVDENSGTYEVQTWECSDPEDCSSTEEHWQPYDKSDPESKSVTPSSE